ncbi:universal stress protein [Luteipulveratus mongoliensis]|uniref:Universal stress protein UspA n=1 Tax=Luteipulveratus mongoliensis TaxID=571913 RepID=A0A0K1JKI6_9MICO|nr:universal stress protein [Luteipulveratus mongoliensis]AKU17222.1 universal stress protein UspA [Luteipulveratus mongoliensis]
MTVVVGYVATKEGKAALERAVQEATERSTKLLVLDSRASKADEEPVSRLLEEAGRSGVEVELRSLTHTDDPAEDIIAAADEVGAELIVIGLRRRTPVGKLILGSNAQRILLDAACPVLAVKAPASA